MKTPDLKDSKLKKILTTSNTSDVIAVNNWWCKDQDDEDDETKWRKLEHKGVLFPPRYENQNIGVLYKQQPIKLNDEQEELATFWAGLTENPIKDNPIAQRNFFAAFKKSLGSEYNCSSLEDFDFSRLWQAILDRRLFNKNKTKEEKQADKLKKQELEENFAYALIDGVSEKISNYTIEPPGIFRGRGEHPKSGTIKSRILPEHVTINIGLDDPVPKCDLPGHAWKDIVSQQEVTWLASYRDPENDKSTTYVFLSANSKFKGLNDMKKYEKAKVLKDKIEEIRKKYMEMVGSSSSESKQLGVATYLIDRLALRVGNEKKSDEADTVGCCSLRVEHVKFEEGNKVVFDFLGKDSMRYFNTVEVDPKVFENMKNFARGKSGKDDLFELINASKLNEFLKGLMDNLSAKVFRTFNASFTLQRELDKEDMIEEVLEEKLKYYKKANRDVAILCNHQKTVGKNYDQTTEKLQIEMDDLKDYLKELENHLKGAKSKKEKKKENENEKKRVFPVEKTKTKKLIETIKEKIRKLEAKVDDRVDD